MESIHNDAVYYRYMSHESDQAILEIYNRTQFMVRDEGGRDIYFAVGDTEYPDVIEKKQFAIITAWNPMNGKLPVEENKGRNNELEAVLKEQNLHYYPSIGICGDHSEESFTVENISKDDAVSLGKRFGQHAIVYCDEEGLRFLFDGEH